MRLLALRVLLATATTALALEPRPDKLVVLTFDDGFRDNYETAFPLLKTYGMPAAVFIATQPLTEGISLWPYRLRFLVKKSRTRRLELKFGDGDNPCFDLSSDRRRRRAVDSIEGRLLSAAPAERARLLETIAQQLCLPPDTDPLDELPMLTWDQLRKMVGAGIEIGSHTVTHPALSTLGREQALKELAQSKQTIESARVDAVNAVQEPEP